MNSEFTGSGSKPESYAPPWRLYGWILSCVVSLALFVGRGSLAGQCIQKTVYYFSSAALLVFLYYFISWLYRAWRTWCPPRTVLLLGGGLVLVSGCFLWVHADFSFKTLPDEYMTPVSLEICMNRARHLSPSRV